MSNKNIKIIITLAIIVFVLLLGNLFVSVRQEIDYNRRKESGNDRWLQVENRILQIEEEIDEVQKDGRNS
mgnify:FL=1|jgi:hypothetical protein|uniref:Uncharacterized protein n=1 Tax=Myoviridae sp. ct8mY9 TaxID=2827664 RepID=A0A8S5SEQ0_9CAUD|nr:MAG TPA: hypothetical protein [Myoviridae sp. ct8mY9]